jgi:hypothetical protein
VSWSLLFRLLKGKKMSANNSKVLQLDEISRKVRDGLFLAPSRTYGEQYIEPFIRELYELSEPTKNDHDAIGKSKHLYEIKACKVLKSNKSNNKKKKDILSRIISENSNAETNRLIPFKNSKIEEYLANVQNVKRDHFDTLIYVLLFEDCLKIFFAPKSIIKKSSNSANAFPNWSDKHGRYDKKGKSGQFGITKTNIQWHLDNCLKDTVTYPELVKIYQKLAEEHASKKYNNSK